MPESMMDMAFLTKLLHVCMCMCIYLGRSSNLKWTYSAYKQFIRSQLKLSPWSFSHPCILFYMLRNWAWVLLERAALYFGEDHVKSKLQGCGHQVWSMFSGVECAQKAWEQLMLASSSLWGCKSGLKFICMVFYQHWLSSEHVYTTNTFHNGGSIFHLLYELIRSYDQFKQKQGGEKQSLQEVAWERVSVRVFVQWGFGLGWSRQWEVQAPFQSTSQAQSTGQIN